MKVAILARRSRSNDGIRGSLVKALPIRDGLLASLIAEFHEVRERRAPRVFHGPKPAGKGGVLKLTDEQVLVLRRMRDWHGMTCSQIAEATSLSGTTVDMVCAYRNRVHLDPGPRPTDAGDHDDSPRAAAIALRTLASSAASAR